MEKVDRPVNPKAHRHQTWMLAAGVLPWPEVDGGNQNPLCRLVVVQAADRHSRPAVKDDLVSTTTVPPNAALDILVAAFHLRFDDVDPISTHEACFSTGGKLRTILSNLPEIKN